MEELLKKYRKDLATFTDLLESCNDNNRLKIKELRYKVSCHKNMVADLERAMAEPKNENSGLHLQRVIKLACLCPRTKSDDCDRSEPCLECDGCHYFRQACL